MDYGDRNNRYQGGGGNRSSSRGSYSNNRRDYRPSQGNNRNDNRNDSRGDNRSRPPSRGGNSRPGQHQSPPIHDPYLNLLRKEQAETTFRLSNGTEFKGTIDSFDQTVVLLNTGEKGLELIYKHAIASVAPVNVAVSRDGPMLVYGQQAGKAQPEGENQNAGGDRDEWDDDDGFD